MRLFVDYFKGIKMKRLLVLASLLSGMGVACAEGYFGGAYGPTHGDIECPTGASCDKTDAGWKFYMGSKLNDTWAIEAAYINYGKASAADETTEVSFRAESFAVSGVGRFALTSSLTANGRLGVAYVQAKSSAGGSERQARPMVGFGIAYAASPNVSLTLDADFTQAKLDGESATVRLLSAGVMYAY